MLLAELQMTDGSRPPRGLLPVLIGVPANFWLMWLYLVILWDALKASRRHRKTGEEWLLESRAKER